MTRYRLQTKAELVGDGAITARDSSRPWAGWHSLPNCWTNLVSAVATRRGAFGRLPLHNLPRPRAASQKTLGRRGGGKVSSGTAADGTPRRSREPRGTRTEFYRGRRGTSVRGAGKDASGEECLNRLPEHLRAGPTTRPRSGCRRSEAASVTGCGPRHRNGVFGTGLKGRVCPTLLNSAGSPLAYWIEGTIQGRREAQLGEAGVNCPRFLRVVCRFCRSPRSR